MHMLVYFGVFSVLILGSSPVHARRVIRAAAGAPTTGCYIVKLSDSITHDQFDRAVRDVASLANDSKVYERIDGEVTKLFTMNITHEEADQVIQLVFKIILAIKLIEKS